MSIDDAEVGGQHEVGGGVDLPHAVLGVDHCTSAISRLISQYRGQPNIEAVLCIWGDRYTGIEQALQDVMAFRSLDTAYGVGLDILGKKLNLQRNGLADESYRVRLRARAQVIASRGTPDELLAILETLVDGASVTSSLVEAFPAGAVIETYPLELMQGEAFAKMLQDATPAAVRLVFQHDGGFHLFGWDEDATAFPWGEDADDTDGGIWAEAT